MMAKKKRFKIKGTADYGLETYLEMVVGVLKQRQTNLIVHDVKTHLKANGRPFQNIARVEIPDGAELETMKEWVLDSLRLFYGGPPFVVMVEEDLEDNGGGSVVDID